MSDTDIRKVVQDYKNFRANGINDILSDEEKQQIAIINQDLEKYLKQIADIEEKQASMPRYKNFTTAKGGSFSRKLYSFDYDYKPETLAIIFTHGKSNYKMWFLNSRKALCLIDDAKVSNNTVYLSIIIDVNGRSTPTQMSLDRFIYLVENGEFKITNKKFVDVYLKPVEESKYYQKLEEEKQNLKLKIDEIKNSDFYKTVERRYQDTQAELGRLYNDVVAGEVREIPADPADKAKTDRKRNRIEKGQSEMKTLWNSVVSESDRAYFMGWLCKHIRRITIKVVDRGVSDYVISAAYPDNIYGTKYREKANSSGWDASSGIISVDSTEDAPIDTIKSLSTIKHMRRSDDGGATVFNGKEISNLDLCLFLLSKYNDYGFKSGVGNLNALIDVVGLRDNLFKDNISDFNAGYDGNAF